MKNQAANNGTFIPKPGFTVVQNSVARDWNLSSGAFGLLNTCLTEMCCTTDTQSYRGALVTADKVLAEISCASNGCEEDGLEPYVEDVLDTFLQAITTRKVKNLPQYMKSLLWTSFATYKLNTISGITAPYKEVKNVYGLH